MKLLAKIKLKKRKVILIPPYSKWRMDVSYLAQAKILTLNNLTYNAMILEEEKYRDNLQYGPDGKIKWLGQLEELKQFVQDILKDKC